jgi:nucleoside-diphosphate-sugar epimerase
VTHLVYAASAGARTERAYERAYLTGLSNVLRALGDERLERVIFTSSTAVYGQSDGRWVDETSPTSPTHFSGRILLEAERLLLARPGEAIALRLAGIYGPGRTRLVRAVHEGRAHVAPDVYGNRIHRDDCAGALAHLLFHPSPEPLYVGADDDPAPLAEVHDFVASLLGMPRSKLAQGPTPDAEAGARTNKRCRNERLRASGYALRVPSYREGYPAIVREYLDDPGRSAVRRSD